MNSPNKNLHPWILWSHQVTILQPRTRGFSRNPKPARTGATPAVVSWWWPPTRVEPGVRAVSEKMGRWPWKFGAFSMGNLGKSRENPWKIGKIWGKSMEVSWNPWKTSEYEKIHGKNGTWKHQNMRKSMEKLGHVHQNMDTSMNKLEIFIRKLWKHCGSEWDLPPILVEFSNNFTG